MSVMKRVMGAALLAGALGLGAGCTEQVDVQLECVLADGHTRGECTLKQTKGKSEVEACWDFSATCGNGAVVKAARTCHKIKGGGTEKVTIGADKLTGADKCGGATPPTAKLEKLTIAGKAAKP